MSIQDLRNQIFKALETGEIITIKNVQSQEVIIPSYNVLAVHIDPMKIEISMTGGTIFTIQSEDLGEKPSDNEHFYGLDYVI